MTSRTILSVLVPVAVLAGLSCSKTQDTAPERRIFGNPPTIQSVDKDHFFTPDRSIKCDFTEVILREICYLEPNYPALRELQAQAGDGWTLNPETGIGERSPVPSEDPGVFIEGSYGEAVFSIKATDPDSPPKPEPSNILLVSASFVNSETNPPTETSLVVFDDGSVSKFNQAQAQGPPGENCVIDPDGSCQCSLGVYPVTSGDGTTNDDTYTRKIALHDPKAEKFLLDCIMREVHETLIRATGGSRIEFKIEVVDRQGNLGTWSEKLVADTNPGINPFTCNGDSCGCCILHFAGLDSACYGLPGMLGPPGSGFECGLCAALQNPC